MKDSTAQNPVPELPRALRATFGKPGKNFYRLFSRWEASFPNEALRIALAAHKHRKIVPEHRGAMDAMKAYARVVQLQRITAGRG
jgi:hypothetical protein